MTRECCTEKRKYILSKIQRREDRMRSRPAHVWLLGLALTSCLVASNGLAHGSAAQTGAAPGAHTVTPPGTKVSAPGAPVRHSHPGDRGRRGYGDCDALGGGSQAGSTGANGEATLYGLVGESDSPDGYGGYFEASGTGGHGVSGTATNSEGRLNYGGYFVAAGSEGRAVYGSAYNWGDGRNYGGYFEASGAKGQGVYGRSSGASGIGVKGLASGTDGQGVRGEAGGAYGYGGAFVAYGRHGIGIHARGREYAGDFQGMVAIRSYGSGDVVIELGEGLDYAEGFDTSLETAIPPGTVLIIDPEVPGRLTVSLEPYDTKVAGIVAGARGLGSGVRLGSGQHELDVALAGRVYCFVDAREEGVEPGDLLTTSSTPGYAMKAIDRARAQGAILGKAMERLQEGQTGLLLVLVTLQ
jgi:hypothetical protein